MEKRAKVREVITNFKRYVVTPAEVDACKRVQTDLGDVFYVATAGTPADPKVSIVRHDPNLKRLVCTCKDSFAPTCWCRRAATVVEREYQEDQKQRKNGQR